MKDEPDAANGVAADDELVPHVEPGVALLGPFAGKRLREASLVLRSMGIQHFVEPARLGSYLLVLDRDRARSEQAIRRYDDENKNWPPPRRRETNAYTGFPFTAVAFVALAAFMWVTGPERTNSAWFTHGTSVSDLVMTGHPERAITALTLHADATHVWGNVLSGAIFGHLVERRMGPGLGLFSIVVAGSVGNLANAAFYFSRGEPHGSIGASTAVMGAVGILAATQALVSRTDVGARSFRDWLAPLLGGLALLGTLGSSAESDLGAHGFGFIGGLVAGAGLFAVLRRFRASLAVQGALGLLAAGIIGGSWMLALAR